MPLFASNRNDDTRAEHEYAYNREQSEKTHKANTPADTESYVIRPNGYGIPSGRVPYDSPYRRPAPAALNAEDENQDAGGNTQKNVEKVMGPRRRRIRVQELFGDAGEGNSQYEAPKPVIDRNEAYYSPVYPRNWKENGDNRG